MHESSDPIKPSTPQNSIIQIGLIILAAFALYIWNSQRKPPPTITIPENTAASASEKSSISKMSEEKWAALIDRSNTKRAGESLDPLTGSPARRQFIKSCSASLTEREDPAAMRASPAEREAMCATMHTAR